MKRAVARRWCRDCRGLLCSTLPLRLSAERVGADAEDLVQEAFLKAQAVSRSYAIPPGRSRGCSAFCGTPICGGYARMQQRFVGLGRHRRPA